MNDITKWISVGMAILAVTSLVCGAAWYFGHSDAAITSLQEAVVKMTLSAEETRKAIDNASLNITSLQNEIIAMREQITALSDNVSIKEDFQQKEIEGVIQDVKALESRSQ